jgi:hypothetical protein
MVHGRSRNKPLDAGHANEDRKISDDERPEGVQSERHYRRTSTWLFRTTGDKRCICRQRGFGRGILSYVCPPSCQQMRATDNASLRTALRSRPARSHLPRLVNTMATHPLHHQYINIRLVRCAVQLDTV